MSMCWTSRMMQCKTCKRVWDQILRSSQFVRLQCRLTMIFCKVLIRHIDQDEIFSILQQSAQ